MTELAPFLLQFREGATGGGRLDGAAISKLSHLRVLFVTDSNDHLTATIPREVLLLPQLDALNLCCNELVNFFLCLFFVFLFFFLNYHYYYAFVPLISDAIKQSGELPDVFDQSKLTFLGLHNNELSGTLPASIFGSRLTSLRVYSNRLSAW